MPELPSPAPRRLPWEVILLVLNQADPSTLAVLGRVSYDILHALSPLLYGSVTVSSVKALEGLFCEREEAKALKPSRVNSLLSLSRIRTLSLDFSSPSSSIPSTLSLSFSRLDGPDPLPLDHLRVRIHPSTSLVYPLFHSTIFPRLNPTRFAYAWFGKQDGESILFRVSRPRQALSAWTRIQKLSFVGGMVYLVPEDGVLLLGGLVKPSLDRRRIVRIRVDIALVASVLFRLGRGSRNFGFEGMQDGTIILVARSEEEKVEIEGLVRASQDIERWRCVFAVEVGKR